MNDHDQKQNVVEIISEASSPAAGSVSKASLLGKLRKAGEKGLTLGKFGLKSKNARALLEPALAELEANKLVTRAVASGRAVYYLSRFAPGLESVSGKLERQARESRGLLLSKEDLKRALGKAEIAFFTPALCRLLGEKVLVKLQHAARGKRNGSERETDFYLHRATLQEKMNETFRPEPAGGSFSSGGRGLLQAYQDLLLRNGFPDVEIAELQQELGIPMPEVNARILEEREAGRAVLSFGDWSLASEKTRSGAIEINGDRYLRVRFQS